MSLAEKDLRVLNRRIVKDVIDRPPRFEKNSAESAGVDPAPGCSEGGTQHFLGL